MESEYDGTNTLKPFVGHIWDKCYRQQMDIGIINCTEWMDVTTLMSPVGLEFGILATIFAFIYLFWFSLVCIF